MTSLESVSECEELLRAERNEALQYTTDLKRSVADLARQEEEAYRELEVERALLEAECGDVEREVERLESILLQLNERSRTMELRHSGDRDQDHQDLRVGVWARESLDCASNSFMDCEAGAREAEVQQKQEKLSGKFSLENIIEDSRQRNRANIAAAVGGSMSRGLSPRSPEALCGRPGPTGASSRQGLGVLQSDSSRVTSHNVLCLCSDEVDSNAYQGQPSQLSFSDVVMRDHERGGEDLRPLSESSSFCGAAGDHTPPSFCGASGDHTPTSFGATGDHTPTSFGATGENAPPSVRFRPRSGTRSKQQRPLTRYLPVKSTEPSSLQFNLRQHIESAGHQIELCSNIVLTSTSCRGYLHKLSGSAKNKSPQGGALVSPHQTSKNSGRLFGMKAYNKRWFVFDRDEKALIYYADKSESKAKGFIYFADIEEVYVDHLNAYTVNGSKKSGKNCPAVAFCVKARSRTLSLLAPSPAAMRIWVEVIFTGAEGYHTYDEY
ncbi:hypothetical protein HAZT_HAZT004333 [Hyalella azteca]|uniref:PH domain-containing protein n=1 Tax=Hyalella azteca TaxID=294128 RepID=A0A6A0GS58_HYAAZ|nr:hypothetical protein HAZT_HAZT004333 [Hyalella azteca]